MLSASCDGGRVPGVGTLLAEHGEDVAEHVAEGVVTHGSNLKGARERHARVVDRGVAHEVTLARVKAGVR